MSHAHYRACAFLLTVIVTIFLKVTCVGFVDSGSVHVSKILHCYGAKPRVYRRYQGPALSDVTVAQLVH